MIQKSEIEAYERDGALCIRSVIDGETIAELLQASRDLMAAERHEYPFDSRSTRAGDTKTVDNEPGRFFSGIYMSETLPVFRDFAMNSALPQAAATLMRSSVARFFYDQLFAKEPGTVSPTPWHHDLPFWPLSGTHIISCWVALTHVSKHTSGVEYAAGSHRWGKLYRPSFAQLRGDASMEQAPDFNDAAQRANHRFLSWDLQPGDVLFHHPLTLHGAGGNMSANQDRFGLSVRYMGDDVQWTPREGANRPPRDPRVSPGDYPDDEAVFPTVWRKTE